VLATQCDVDNTVNVTCTVVEPVVTDKTIIVFCVFVTMWLAVEFTPTPDEYWCNTQLGLHYCLWINKYI